MATKKELASSIVSEFPDRGHDEKKLVEAHTHSQLTDLLSSLRAEDSEPSSQASEHESEQESEQTKDAAQPAASEKDLYRLADPTKHYHSRAFNIKGEEQKPLPDRIDDELSRRIRAGYLVKVGD